METLLSRFHDAGGPAGNSPARATTPHSRISIGRNFRDITISYIGPAQVTDPSILFELFGELRNNLKEISNYPIRGHVEDWSISISVNGDNTARVLHPDDVLTLPLIFHTRYRAVGLQIGRNSRSAFLFPSNRCPRRVGWRRFQHSAPRPTLG